MWYCGRMHTCTTVKTVVTDGWLLYLWLYSCIRHAGQLAHIMHNNHAKSLQLCFHGNFQAFDGSIAEVCLVVNDYGCKLSKIIWASLLSSYLMQLVSNPKVNLPSNHCLFNLPATKATTMVLTPFFLQWWGWLLGEKVANANLQYSYTNWHWNSLCCKVNDSEIHDSGLQGYGQHTVHTNTYIPLSSCC